MTPTNLARPVVTDTSAAVDLTTSQGRQRVELPPPVQRLPEFSEIVLGCRHHLLRVMLLGACLSCVLAAGAWWLIDAPYEAESLVQVRQHQDVVFSAQTSLSQDAAFVRAQEQLVLSPQVLSAALRREQLLPYVRYLPTRDPVDWLSSRLTADIKVGTELLSVSAFHPDPEVAHALCNAVTSSYMEEITNRLSMDRRLREQELERAAREADRKLDALWEELNAVASRVGTENTQSLTIRDEIQLQAYRDYAQQLRVAQMRGNELKQRLASEQFKQPAEQTSIDEATELMLQNQPEIVVARRRVSDINAQIQQMREIVAQVDSPRLMRLIADREFLEADLQRLMDERRPLIRIQSIEQDKSTKENSLAQLRQQIEANEAEKEFLRTRLAEIDTGSTRTDKQSGVQLEISRHAVERQTRLADGLWQSLEELRIESQSQPRVALIKLADFPDHANHGRQLKAAAALGGLGWFFVIAAVGCREWYSCRVRKVADIESHCLFPVLGVPQDNRPATQPGDLASHGAMEAAAKLMLLNPAGLIPTLMVSSPTADEPRHLVALDLSRAFATLRKRTLLIDCDTTQSQLTSMLAAESLPGLFDAITEEKDPCEVIQHSDVERLDVLPLGTGNKAANWLEPNTLAEVLTAVRENYDAVIVHGPPMLSSAESLLFAAHTDQTLLAIFTDISRWDQAAASERIAADCGIRLAGAILHSANEPAPLQLVACRAAAPDAHETNGAHKTNGAQESAHEWSETTSDATELSLHQGVTSIGQEIQRAASGGKPACSQPQPIGEVPQ